MSYDANKVIQIAEAEIGYLEKKTNAKLDDKTANAGNKNYTKYARDLDALGFYNGRKNGFAWCDIFVDWCFVQAYGLEAALKLTNQPLGKANCGAGATAGTTTRRRSVCLTRRSPATRSSSGRRTRSAARRWRTRDWCIG